MTLECPARTFVAGLKAAVVAAFGDVYDLTPGFHLFYRRNEVSYKISIQICAFLDTLYST